jgi:hypothetical protein
MKSIALMCGVYSPATRLRAFVFPMCLVCALCTPEAPRPVEGQWDRIYSVTPPELLRYGRAYAVDTLYFRYDTPNDSDSGDARTRPAATDPVFSRLSAGLLEFSRGQTPDGFQAEQRGLLYDSLHGFTSLADSGLYPNRENSVHSPADSPRFRFSGQPATGFLIQDREGEVEIVAPPLSVLRDLQLGLARYTLFAGRVEIRGRGAGARPAHLVFQRLYLPAVNPFDEDARRLWAARARLWLAIQDPGGAGISGGEIVFAREQGGVLNPLFATGAPDREGAQARGDFAFLTRPREKDAGEGVEFFPARFQIAPAANGPEFTGAFQLLASGDADSATRCEFRLEALHSIELHSVSRATSQVAAARGELVCPQRRYRLHGLMRVWPEEGEE